ncbi:histone deacetylase family protein [Tundrisphaera lichenicola]|uniref:histone deacetylase family protein n=1 Tax=Tundrisphaera lichenicola TaxID=2029860 RepID=UPI003EB79C79
MVTLYRDTRMLDHVPGPQHPERPERLSAILRHLERTGLARHCPTPIVRPATDEELLRVHTPGHIAGVERAAAEGGGLVEVDTWISHGSPLAARLAAGAVVDAVTSVIEGPEHRAFCAVRPPGHHARPDHVMGFCLFASVAVAAAHAVARHELGRILIVDFDVHHGNGTQEIFYDDPGVSFLSIHRYPFYPGSGAADETGTGRGLRTTRNVPIAAGTSRPEYLAAFRSHLERMADQVRPELVLLSAGFDAHAEDPVGNLGLEVEDFEEMTRGVIAVAEAHAGGRLVSVLEGGYNVPILAGCVASHLETLGAESY